jgi:hypothetical protein
MSQKINLLVILGLILTLISCNSTHKSLTHEQIVKDYFYALNTGDFSIISNCISDSIMTTEKEYILTYNQKELYQQFQWDSVFKPKYELTDLKMDSTSVKATVSKICARIVFLQDSAMIYKVQIDFKDNQITKVQTTEYVFLDFAKWQPRRDTLTSWIDKNYPELSGFVYDLTLKGAQNYLTAIDLYKNEK